MSDLISRSELLKAFNEKNIQITFDLPVEEVLGEDVDLDDFAMLVQDATQAYRKMAINTIKNHPTAYDIDKVVEELEEASFYDTYNSEDTKVIDKDKAIEIVKQGGVSDDVCEWRKHSIVGFYSEHIGAVRIINIADWYKYCHYFGKKIKVVE